MVPLHNRSKDNCAQTSLSTPIATVHLVCSDALCQFGFFCHLDEFSSVYSTGPFGCSPFILPVTSQGEVEAKEEDERLMLSVVETGQTLNQALAVGFHSSPSYCRLNSTWFENGDI